MSRAAIKLVEELANSYAAGPGSTNEYSDALAWWCWAADKHKTVYPVLISRIKVDDERVDSVRRRLLAELRAKA